MVHMTLMPFLDLSPYGRCGSRVFGESLLSRSSVPDVRAAFTLRPTNDGTIASGRHAQLS